MLNSIIRFFLENKLIAYLLLILFVGLGISNAPFDFNIPFIPKDPVAVDAIPNIGENQQIVFTEWKGRSPQDVEDQLTYPLTTALLGVPGVRSVRSNSMFGYSSIYLIFEDQIDFYWSRSRILEKLNALPQGLLPDGVQPTLGPDATALGQIFWYTLEGYDTEGNPTGGWDLHELRSIQDFYVRYALSSAEGVAEVASVGGYVKEYQVDVDPEAMKAYNISLEELMQAVNQSNLDVGAQTIEINLAEYFVRGLGYIEHIEDLENSIVRTKNNVAITIGDVAKVNIGPANRRGVLDKSGAEAVGGVVVARFDSNPMEVIQNVKSKIKEIEVGLPKKTLNDGTLSHLKIVPFYDRSDLINETIGTLEEALSLEILITMIVVILMLFNLRSSILVAGSLPVAVLMCFIAMRYFGVDANIVALSGIAIAIGTMVDMGIVLTESMVKRIKDAPDDEDLMTSIFLATKEVASAVLTAVATTIISFLPVFTMQAAEGKLFRPLAFTKTFALIAAIIVAISIIPPLAHSLFSFKNRRNLTSWISNFLAVISGIVILFITGNFLSWILVILGISGILKLILSNRFDHGRSKLLELISNFLYAIIVSWLLAKVWMPLGVSQTELKNFFFIILLVGGLLLIFYLLIHFYEQILRFFLEYKIIFLLLVGLVVWKGFKIYKNTGEEFMPALDEGSFLLMPTSMPHSGMEENIRNLQLLDMSVTSIPEVDMVVGKAGRVNSALDPAPMSMYENVILYKSEYKTDEKGRRIRFKYDNGAYARDTNGALIPDKEGQFYRQWRDHIQSPDDIWNEIINATQIPGVTSAPKLQPIETRLVMLQTGMRAPMGIKVQGTDLEQIQAFGFELEEHIKQVEGVKTASVFADRIVGKPYLIIDIDREAIGRQGISILKIQQYIQAAIGGMIMTTTVEGRERYNIRVRYPRELRNDQEELENIYIPNSRGQQIPLGELVEIRYEQGTQSIKSEDGFLIGYVLFDKMAGYSEVEVVENARDYLNDKLEDGTLLAPDGIQYRFAGNYEQQQRANQRLMLVIPIALLIIFLILYFQFQSILISLMVFTGVIIAFAGGFIMIGLYDTPWFLDFNFLGVNMRDLFQVKTINLSVAVWVGFLALFGIATDDGVLVASFLKDSFKRNKPESIDRIRDAVVEGGLRRVRPAMMTTATTILALIPILSSTGRGSDIMVPMAIPSFGGMCLQVITMFTVPILFSIWKEWGLKLKIRKSRNSNIMKNISLIFVLVCANGFALQSQGLDSLLNLVNQENLSLQSYTLEEKAALEMVPQVGQYPDPEVSIGVFPLPVETRLGAQLFRVGISQMIPWPGVLEQRRLLELQKSGIYQKQRESHALDLKFQLKKSYLSLYKLKETQKLLNQNIEILQSLEKLILARVEAGKSSASDVIRVQISIESLKQENKILEQRKWKDQYTINQILNRAPNEEIVVRDSFPFAYPNMNLEEIQKDLLKDHPGIRIYNIKQEISKKAQELNEYALKPSIGIGLDYIMVNQRNDASPERNGRDIVQLRASTKIPLFKDRYRAKSKQEQLKIESLEIQKKDKTNLMVSNLQKAIIDYENARLKFELAEKQSELCQAAINILESEYSSQASKLDELLRLSNDKISFQKDKLEAIIGSHEARFAIEYIIDFN